jgi:hypothetical protein
VPKLLVGIAGIVGIGAASAARAEADLAPAVVPATSASDAGVARAGPRVASEAPPAGAAAWPTACSPVARLCVSAAPGTPPERAAEALAAAERMWATVTEALGAPAPEGALGSRWRVFLVDDVDGGGTARLEARDPRDPFDRGASFALVDRRIGGGCGLELAMARAVARGSLWRAAPASDEGSATARAEALAHLAVPCSSRGAAPDDAAEFQAHPERCVVDATSASFARGAGLFFDWVDARFGAQPGALLVGLSALAPTATTVDAWRAGRWAAAPTAFDVLRVSLADRLWKGSTLDDVFVRFALDRAAPEGGSGAAVAWSIGWPAAGRRLAAGDPPAPTGESIVVVDRAGAPTGARLRLEAQWEDYARMRWMAVKVDASGRVLSEIPIRTLDRVTHASLTLDDVGGAARVRVVGVDLGSTERAFDPDQGEWEPHGWLLTVAAE